MTQDKNREAFGERMSDLMLDTHPIRDAGGKYETDAERLKRYIDCAYQVHKEFCDHYAPKLTEKEAIKIMIDGQAIREPVIVSSVPGTIHVSQIKHAALESRMECAVVALKAAGMRFKEEA